MYIVVKCDFLQVLEDYVLKLCDMDYVVQFFGFIGINVVEVVLKIVCNIKGCENIISFINGFYGVILGVLFIIGNSYYCGVVGVIMGGVSVMLYDGYLGDVFDIIEYLDKVFLDFLSGVDYLVVVIVEIV